MDGLRPRRIRLRAVGILAAALIALPIAGPRPVATPMAGPPRAAALTSLLSSPGSLPHLGTPVVHPPAANVAVAKHESLITAADSPGVVVSPTNPADMVVVNQVDRPDYTAEVHFSTDGGRTWHPSALQPPPESDFSGALALVPHKLYAPNVVIGPHGSVYVEFVTLSGSGNQPDGVWIERSTDGGQSFLPPTAIAGPHSFQVTIAIDHRTGRLYATWLQAQQFLCVLCFPTTGQTIMVNHSSDHGATWSTPVQVSTPGLPRVGAPAIEVGPRGNPAVLYYDFEGDRLDWGNLRGTYHGHFRLLLARSADGGNNFGSSQVVDANVVPTGRFIVYLAAPAGFAIGGDGEMVVAWPDGRSGSNQVLLRTSVNSGVSWTPTVAVNTDTAQGSVQSLPAVSIAPDGRVDIVYYDGTATSAGVYLSSSGDGGASFAPATELTTSPSSLLVGSPGSPYSPTAYFGGHIAVVSGNHGAITAWTDTRSGNISDGMQAIYFASLSVATPASSGPGIIVILVVGLAVVLALAGAGLLLASRRGRKERPGPPGSEHLDAPPPPPPLVPAPGKV